VGQTTNKKTSCNNAPHNQPDTIWIQNKSLHNIDAVIKAESYVEKATPETHLLMDITKAFGKVNRTILWGTLYKRATEKHDNAHKKRTYGNNSTSQT